MNDTRPESTAAVETLIYELGNARRNLDGEQKALEKANTARTRAIQDVASQEEHVAIAERRVKEYEAALSALGADVPEAGASS